MAPQRPPRPADCMRRPPATAPPMPIAMSMTVPYPSPLRIFPPNQPATNPTTIHDNPRQEVHAILLLLNLGLTFIRGAFPDFGKHCNLAALAFPLCRTTRGADLARPSKRRGLPTSGRYCNSNLVERRVSDVIGFNLRISVNYRGEDLRHFWISCAVVGLGILGFVPQTDCERFRPALSDERDFVLESFLFSKQGEDVLL